MFGLFIRVINKLVEIRWVGVFRKNREALVHRPFAQWFGFLEHLSQQRSDMPTEGITWKSTMSELSRKLGCVTKHAFYKNVVSR